MSDQQQSAAAPQAAEQVIESKGLLDQIVDEGRLAKDRRRPASAARTWSRSSSPRCLKAR